MARPHRLNPAAVRTAVVPAGSVLFHGTAAKFRQPRVGGDGVLWFSDDPRIAQLYIPQHTASVTFTSHDLTRPVEQGLLRDVQRGLGIVYDYDRVVWHRDRAASFHVPRGWTRLPTEEDLVERLHAKGMKPRWSGLYEARFDGNKLLGPDERVRGHLVVATLQRSMKVWLKALGENDAMDLQYQDLAGFALAEAAGLDGVILDDFAQSEAWGNVGHPSLGLFQSSLAFLRVVNVPAQYHEWSHDSRGTPAWPDPPPPFLRDLIIPSRPR